MLQVWNSDDYQNKVAFVPELGADILLWLDPQKGQDILDLGCGDGRLTLNIAAQGAKVLGLDASADLLKTAKERGLNVMEGDGQALTFHHQFDCVFSNAALHWMTKPDDVLKGVFRALKPGGRFVAEFGGFGNIAAIVTALQALAHRHGLDPASVNPWFFPNEQDYQMRLEAAGFTVKKLERIPRLTPLPTGITGWLETFMAGLWQEQDEKQRLVMLNEMVDLLRPALCDHEGKWYADYVRLRCAAYKPL